MSFGVEKEGKSIDEAVTLALKELSLKKDEVEIEILEEGNKGIFGLFGNRMAKVRVKPSQDLRYQKVNDFIKQILAHFQMDANVDMSVEQNIVTIKISGENVGILIGRRGETLEALQSIASLVLNKYTDQFHKLYLDIEGYRDKREDTLVKLAQRIADKVRSTKKSVTLEPMSSSERRIIHAALQEDISVMTFSTGSEPYRKIVVKPKG